MPFDDSSIVQRFQGAVESLALLGTIQERLDNAFSQLRPLRFENFPPEVRDKYKGIHEGLARGTQAHELSDEDAVKVARVIVEVSHELTALWEETMATWEAQSSLSPTGETPSAESPRGPEMQQEAETKTQERKCRVFLHTRNHGTDKMTNEEYDFARIPIIGELVALASVSPCWYKVQLVVHTPFERGLDAEVYAVAVDPKAAQKQAMPDFPSS
jgi:hypothetical protein